MAVPNPERELKRLATVLRKGLPKVLIVAGASPFFRDEAVDAVLAALPADADLRRIDGQEDTDGREIDDLRGAGLFGSGNVVCVRRGEGWLKRHGDALVALLERGVGAGCALVLEVQKLDKRTKLSKQLAAAGEWFEFRDLYAEPYDRTRSPLEAELVGWTVERARTHDLVIGPDAAFLIVSVVGKEPGEIVRELRRLQAVLPRGRRIGPDELRPHLSIAFESTPFEFAEAVLAFDRARVMRSIAAMFDRGVRTREGTKMDRGGVFPFVVSWTWQSFATAHRGRRLLDSGVPESQLAARAGVRVFADRFTAQVRTNPEPRLRRGLYLLLEAQRELRSTGEDPQWLLERFVARYFREGAA